MNRHTYDTDQLDAWRDYFDRLPHEGAYHSPDYLALIEGNFEFDDEEVELFVLEDGEEFVYYPYFKRPLTQVSFDHPDYDLGALWDIVSSWYYGGPLLSDPDRADLAEAFAKEFSEYCRESGIVAEFVRFDPNIRNDRQFGMLDPEFNRETVPVDLSKSKDQIWEEFTSSNRTHIRQGRDAGFEVDPAETREEVAAFHDIYSDAMDAKDASEHYRFALDFFAEMVLGEDSVGTLLLSRYEGEVVGGSFLVHDGATVNEFLRASEPDLWDLGLNNHLCCEAITYMHDRGYDWLDFQGGRPGVFEFKKAFSPERGQFHLAKRVHDADVYDDLVAAADAAGVDTESGYFPAYRIERSN